MTEVKAQLKSLHIAPRKVRLLADRVRGMKVIEAQQEFHFRAKRSSKPLQKLVACAVANAKHNAGVKNPEEEMFIKTITVDEGRPFKRYMPRAHGRATMYKKRTSHITVVLDSYDA
ncbi:MAG: 50S ribosomal protein L22 [Candidatus Ryanbacteria bacterium RIFCSPHIGHO2_02_FULL_45_43]|uniref:Large ribosomal subunit protein uL22 n=1 Tax=Candidatus Ryanbacteria bacterium RIFCSPHIGHO2_01_45_13 TaxID=1802112 RepID=A0A1G2FWL4_9BACT|nr:MAG: 50S ribosomal protein L22 [Candidatus Ryanbacteria bacterium RIFCSPHIGHO2_01_FULL_44_130]OGZ42469.1 MAG: 50S ribosomal protein L22 [Candidatus Ryanbacteria bacterium RIFCSPHIGHO2_01_45_13]OGZ48486.1 MAG: 50S ribosomal protein L22 [Candidatus Ryanbacteria bacterium RIFCSPHIGHO2_02_FULL_45_43]OGZ50350.1 MAG: 50S ribosomal protein L22 [Candidatus Ryanbacteria bacterium RIFCSPHIGHO2_12_FULL_44_20]OGZ51690.1 MAG: 50S ribosomal protein L22 [Candidatus Ryanbacteria bacterium RIFCSPLOWO2_01_FUL